MIKQRPLANTKVMVPILGQGTMGIGGYFQEDKSKDEEMVRLIEMGIDLGLSFIDTAEVYGAGHSEELVGKAINGRREQVFIATKFSPEHSSYSDVIKAVEGSLRRLNVDQIDLLQTHWRNYKIPLCETARAMNALFQTGKIRFLGVSNFSVNEVREFQACLNDVQLVSNQQEYNVVDRTIENEILPFCKQTGMALIAYSPLLQGKITNSPTTHETLKQIASKYSATLPQLILNWLAAHDQVIIIPKMANEQHLLENAAALNFELSVEDFEALSEILVTPTRLLATDTIKVADDAHRNVYRTVEEAIENRLGLDPSPNEMAKRFLQGEFSKPIKVKIDPSDNNKYFLIEGRVKYWGWVIAFGKQKPIPALIVL